MKEWVEVSHSFPVSQCCSFTAAPNVTWAILNSIGTICNVQLSNILSPQPSLSVKCGKR